MNSRRMPVVFFGHGSPMNTLATNRYTLAWQRLGAALPRPRAILAVSAHWTTRGVAVTAMERPQTIHDFGGFPQALFDVAYPAPGDPALAARIAGLLAPMSVVQDQQWGLDHGTWSVLVHVFPKADVPVVQLSLDLTKPAPFHLDLGSRLQPLRNEGVLIIGSGDVVHNLGVMRRTPSGAPYDWAVRFNNHVRDCVLRRDFAPLLDLGGKDAQLSAPTPEHYLPLLYVLGASDAGDTAEFPVDGIDMASISMLTCILGGA